jgi:hypothetical protein
VILLQIYGKAGPPTLGGPRRAPRSGSGLDSHVQLNVLNDIRQQTYARAWDGSGRTGSTRPAVAAPSDPNHHIESSKEASRESRKESSSPEKEIEKDENLIQYDEAKQLFGNLSEAAFGDPLHETEWPREMEESLKQGLPIKRQNWELIDWFYRLPADDKIFEVTRRRQSLRAVVENLRSEAQKIHSARQIIELDGFLCPSERETLLTGWTVQLRSAAREEFPELMLPERYDMVPRYSAAHC